jgi:hypothetical protein
MPSPIINKEFQHPPETRGKEFIVVDKARDKEILKMFRIKKTVQGTAKALKMGTNTIMDALSRSGAIS